MERKWNRRQVTSIIAAVAVAPSIALVTERTGLAQESSPEASPEASPSASPAAGGNEVEIGSYDIYFEPKEVTIKADTETTIKLPNHGTIQHTFVIDEKKNENLPFDPIKVAIDPGQTEEVKLTAPAGKYYFWCDIPGHEPAGMWGYITAE
jgi:uncharacterized cupredoxin-like copper-binding protein